jgi:signal transduction histidine kinase
MKIQDIFSFITGDRDMVGSEKYFVTIACFVVSIFLILLSIAHLLLGLDPAPVFIAGSSSLVVSVFYYMSRFRNLVFLPKLSLTFYGLFMLDLAWYYKYLSNGPVLFFILIYGALIIWVWDGRSLVILLTIYFMNMTLLFLIDKIAPPHLSEYPDYADRSADIFLSLFFLSSFMIFLLYLVKKEYVMQKDIAQKSERLKAAFLANMSHEIRTPMNAIVGFGELLCNEISAERRYQYNKIIQNSCHNLLRLINDILDLSKIEAGDISLKYTDINIRELFSELVDLYRMELSRRENTDVELDFVFPPEDIILHTDVLRLKQVLSNLLDNAVKFTSKGKITLNCLVEGKELIFSISDTGTGIREEDQKKIFDRFIRFDYNGKNTEGSGIGLSIVYKIIKLLKGRIWVKSIFGEGSTFLFAIPYVQAQIIIVPEEKSACL